MKPVIYLDNAATTPMAKEVLELMADAMVENYGNASSIHALGRKSKTKIETARKVIAKYYGAKPAEIVFTSGGTESNNMAIKNYVEGLGVKRVISSELEHPSVYNVLADYQAKGLIDLVKIGFDHEGQLDIEQLEEELKKGDGQLIVLMHGNNELGNLLPIDQVSSLSLDYGAYFHCDTVQTLGHFAIDFPLLNISSASFSAHKVHGPKGVGFLYYRQGLGMRPLLKGGGQERALRSGTENIPGILGMERAISLAQDDLVQNFKRISSLKQRMLNHIQTLGEKVRVNGVQNQECSLPTLLNIELDCGISSDMLLFSLDLEGLCVSGGSACSSGSAKASRVLQSLKGEVDLPNLRFSFSRLTTEADVDAAFTVLKKVLEKG